MPGQAWQFKANPSRRRRLPGFGVAAQRLSCPRSGFPLARKRLPGLEEASLPRVAPLTPEGRLPPAGTEWRPVVRPLTAAAETMQTVGPDLNPAPDLPDGTGNGYLRNLHV
jgi:hypothetical protein